MVMTMTNDDYVASLDSFLAETDEDGLIVDAIMRDFDAFAPKALLEEINQCDEPLRILDVGAGDGMKGLYFARQFGESRILDIDAVEPKEEQRAKWDEPVSCYNRIYTTPFDQTKFPTDRKYQFLLLFHSLYEFPRQDDGTIAGLDKIDDLLADNGTAIIAVEHPRSDFQQMKRELNPRFGMREPVSEQVITGTLEKYRMPYRVNGRMVDHRFPLNTRKSDVGLGRDVAFLFSDSLEERTLTTDQYAEIGGWIRRHERRDKGESFLWVPDSVMWAYKKER